MLTLLRVLRNDPSSNRTAWPGGLCLGGLEVQLQANKASIEHPNGFGMRPIQSQLRPSSGTFLPFMVSESQETQHKTWKQHAKIDAMIEDGF